MVYKIMESGNVLEEKVQEFCKERNKDEGEIWKRINSMYLNIAKRDLMWEKNEFQKEHNLGDIPMAQWVANCILVHDIIPILDEMINTMV